MAPFFRPIERFKENLKKHLKGRRMMTAYADDDTFFNAAHGYTYGQVADKVWIRTGKNPVRVRCQALLVISTFADDTTAVHRIEDLMAV